MNFTMHTPTIPIIDISALLNTNTSDAKLKACAEKIALACRDNGFFYISGHGIDEGLQFELAKCSQQFMALDLDAKMEISMEKGGRAWRGYFPVGDELTSGKADQKEGIYFGSELGENHPKLKKGIPLHGKNLYPKEPAAFKALIETYFSAMENLGQNIMKGIALSLGLSASYFSEKYTKDPFLLFRIFHYPAQPLTSDSWGVGEHSDYGLLTILKQDEIGGLQVKSKGEWIDAPPIENTFVCNIGDMLDKMTGGLYKSTPHRVRNTSGKSRFSFPFFFDPSFDAKIEQIENLNPAQADYKQRWDQENIHAFGGTYGEYLLEKVSKVFPELKSNLD